MSTILLIRHGESQSNAGQPTMYAEEIELTDLGWRQAECAAREIQESHISPDLMVKSSYRRAEQTAQWTQWLFPDVPVEIWPVHEFDYLASWREKNSTVEDRRSTVEGYWNRSDPFYADNLAAESFEQFIQRSLKILRRLKTIEYNTIAVFSHQQFIIALLWLIRDNPPEMRSQAMKCYKHFLDTYPIPNGAIVRLQLQDSGDSWQFELITSHLERL